MMKKSNFVLSVLLAFVMAGAAYGQTTYTVKPPKPAAEPPKPLAEIIETQVRGRVESNTYKNEFFGLKFAFPENWIVQGPAVGEAIKSAGSDASKGKTAAVDKAIDKALSRTVVLFTVSKDIMGIADNALFLASAEPSTPLTQFRNGTDYLRISLQTMKQMQLPPDFKYSETIQSETFGRESIPYIQIERLGFRQRIYAIHRRGYAVFFTLSYITETDLNTMRDIFRNGDLAFK